MTNMPFRAIIHRPILILQEGISVITIPLLAYLNTPKHNIWPIPPTIIRTAIFCSLHVKIKTSSIGMAGESVGLSEEFIGRACAVAIKAHKSSTGKPFICEISRSSLSEVIFGFTGTWDLGDWFTHKPFGEAKINLNHFPSLKTIGSNEAATVNQAYLQRFEALLEKTSFKNEVEKAATEKQIVFTGHSSGAATAIFATLWFLESWNQRHINHGPPRCITFGSPLVGDKVLTHAVKREHWSQYFTHFIMRYDIIPRISLTPLPSIEKELQPILHYYNPKSPFFASDSVGRTAEASTFVLTVMRNVSLVTSRAACKFMGCTNLLLENVTNFIELSPYRPFGTYVFCIGNGKFVTIKNSDAIHQSLFYCLQLGSESEWNEVAQRSLKEHLIYEHELLESMAKHRVAYLEHLEDLPLSAENMGEGENFNVCGALNDLGLSARARLCLRAAGELEKQKARNQIKISSNKNKIRDVLDMLERYQANSEVRKIGYYDAFKMQKHTEDFHNNIRRLELAGIWDEIIEMLKRNELPDEFEGNKEWIEVGTRYRRLVEPLDIANYYRHLKNEDTGSYMDKGRPSRYRYIQKWREHVEKMKAEPVPESCFWAEVEELCISTRNTQHFENVEERVLHLERNVSLWAQNELLGKDVFLNESSFVQWWKRLPIQHRSVSCIRDLFHV
ncbi:protein EDS1L-like isoform X2 [Chenopodium quinoa]|uniref:protein EDS1L-like isoform X2 n=1 Tax=Chenopodium quinoa TaxID=63459 RepID=UPI000B7793F2|nr:protein EDS1L-like isoform X2 [Chenopodium quinoa]